MSTRQEPTPYDGTMIFKPEASMRGMMAAYEAARNDTSDPLHKHNPKQDVAERIYKETLKALSKSGMISVQQAVTRMGIEVQDYIGMAERGEALLIRMGRKDFVPEWTIMVDGTINPLKLDIAREFVLEGQSRFKFLDFIRFMTEEKADIAQFVPRETLSMVFYTAGVKEFDCRLSVKATMNQLADMAHKNTLYGSDTAPFREMLFRHLDMAVTHGGWDPSGGLSRSFRDKYRLPGMTIYEQRTAPNPK